VPSRKQPATPQGRGPVIAARVSQESYDALMDYCAAEGVTVASLLESMGRLLSSTPREELPKWPPWLRALFVDARAVAAERRRRR
jgi:hypothetical protein